MGIEAVVAVDCRKGITAEDTEDTEVGAWRVGTLAGVEIRLTTGRPCARMKEAGRALGRAFQATPSRVHAGRASFTGVRTFLSAWPSDLRVGCSLLRSLGGRAMSRARSRLHRRIPAASLAGIGAVAATAFLVCGSVGGDRAGESGRKKPAPRIEDIELKTVLTDWKWNKRRDLHVGSRVIAVRRRLFVETCRVNTGKAVVILTRWPASISFGPRDDVIVGYTADTVIMRHSAICIPPRGHEQFFLEPGDVFVNRYELPADEPIEPGPYRVEVVHEVGANRLGGNQTLNQSLEVRLDKNHGFQGDLWPSGAGLKPD